ncbi:uncharacterized protein [Macrobrachium rosenbergii]|uniref:uncharacterized protein n=1 Tax=Macrobrachium rosenbergii TaxID=79674 RepID=UPI0034D6260A
MDDRRPLRSTSSGPSAILVPNNGRLLHNLSSPLDSPILNNTYSSNVPSVSTAGGGLGLSALQASSLNSQGHYAFERTDQHSGRSRGSPHLLQIDRAYLDQRHHLRFRLQPKVNPNPQATATTVTGTGTRSLAGAIMAVGGGAGGSGSRSKSAVVGRVSGGVNVRELASSSGAGGAGSGASGGVRGQIGVGPGQIDPLSSSLPLECLRRHGASVSSLPAVLSGPKFNHKPTHLPSKSRKYMANGSLPKNVFLSNLVDVRACNKFVGGKTCDKGAAVAGGSCNALTRPLIANSSESSPSDDSLPSPSSPPSPRSPNREYKYQQQQPIHTIALWPNIPQVPVKDKALEDTMTGNGCCANCCTKIRTATCGSLILLPVHILLLFVLVGYLALGAFIFSRLEGSAYDGQSQGRRPSTIRLPGTPKSQGMVEANKEMVDRVLNTSMEMVMEKSVDAVFDAILTSQRMQNAIRVFEAYRLQELPSNDRLDILSDEVITEWRLRLYNLTLRYYSIVTRHSYGYEIGPTVRAAAWNSEEPPATASWTIWSSLLHAFCLITTMGGSIQATSSGGRATTVIYTLIGVVLYVGVVTLWAARMTTVIALIVKIFSRKKVESSANGKMVPPGSYEQTSIYAQRLSQLHHSPAGLLIVVFILFVYILSAGVQVVGGNDYGLGLENVLLVLATVRPPNPLPEGSSNIMGFIGFVTVGHILVALLVSIAVTLSGRWWTAAGTTS